MKKIDGIPLAGFSKPLTVEQLQLTRCARVCTKPGVYLVLRSKKSPPKFLKKSQAGWFKGTDPSYPLGVVESNWVPHAEVLYVGKTVCKKGLRGRLRALVGFAYRKRAGHRGGRLLWHLGDWKQLQVVWRHHPAEEVDRIESRLIDEFRAVHGDRPFANMSK